MRRYLLFTFLIFSHFFSIAQNIDSLWVIYNNKSQPDTNRLKALQTISKSYITNNPDTSIILAEQLLALANSSPSGKNKKWIATAYNLIGVALKNEGNFPKALEYQLKSATINEEIGEKKALSACYNSIGVIYYNQANYPKALEYYLKSLAICEEINNTKGIGNCYTNIGLVYKEQLNYTKALDYYFKDLNF